MPPDSRPRRPAGGPLDLTTPRRSHVGGVGGAGMSAVAVVLEEMGHTVTGSDLKASPVVERLVASGIPVSVGHRPEQVGDAEIVTWSPAVGEANAERAEAARRGLLLVARAEMLAAIADTRRCLAVAGTHGKTTTASMLALVLVEAGLHPSFLIGADVNDIGTNAVWDRGEWLVLEADESYGTFTALRPELAVVTNVEPDHLDHYGTFDALSDAFAGFLAGASGATVVGADDPVAASLGATVGALMVGESADADYQVRGLTLARSGVGFDLAGPTGPLGRLEVPVAGRHNAQNAAVAAVAALCAGAPFAAAQTALARFAGVPRRFEFRGEANGVVFVDDYAHLPGEVRATLAAARAGGWGRVVAVFQPHRYTRTAALAPSFAGAFDDADLVVVTDLYGAGEAPIPGISGKLVAEAVNGTEPHPEVHYVAGRAELRRRMSALLRPGDLCVTLGAGDVTTLADELLAEPTW